MTEASALDEAMDKIKSTFQTEAAFWIDNLAEYECPYCGQLSIFKICPECEEDHE